MSDAHQDHHDAPHEGPIKTPKQLILAVLFSFVVPIAVIVLLVSYVATGNKPSAGSTDLSPEAVAHRLQPVGSVEIKDLSDPSAMKTGEQVYTAVCAACHAAGVAGAPKLGDSAGWAPRISTGYAALLNSALKGKGAMGAQGGGDYADLEIGRAVVYMANKSGAGFEEPKLAPPVTAAATQPAEDPQATAAAAQAAQAVAAATAAPASAAAAAPAEAAGGAAPALYAQACQVCHAAGLAGAPKLGDKAAWAERVPLGIDQLTTIAIQGKGAMPPKGGSAASDAEIKEVVTYMVNAVK